MKTAKFTSLLFTFLMFVQISISAQTKVENQIRELEKIEKEAVLKGDTVMLFKLWSPNYVVNTPFNSVASIKEIKGFLREGKIDYTAFDRIIETITLTENIAIVMGKEIINPEKKTDNAGKTVTRRYTNIWVNKNGKWLLTARQATNVLVE